MTAGMGQGVGTRPMANRVLEQDLIRDHLTRVADDDSGHYLNEVAVLIFPRPFRTQVQWVVPPVPAAVR